MSGHSHWAGIKHRKAAQDAKKGVAFQKLIKDVIAAAKAGGGDPNSNFRLKVAIDRAARATSPWTTSSAESSAAPASSAERWRSSSTKATGRTASPSWSKS